jgi:hypothetical protein
MSRTFEDPRSTHKRIKAIDMECLIEADLGLTRFIGLIMGPVMSKAVL